MDGGIAGYITEYTVIIYKLVPPIRLGNARHTSVCAMHRQCVEHTGFKILIRVIPCQISKSCDPHLSNFSYMLVLIWK